MSNVCTEKQKLKSTTIPDINLLKALAFYFEGRYDFVKSAEEFSIPSSTLQCFIDSIRDGIADLDSFINMEDDESSNFISRIKKAVEESKARKNTMKSTSVSDTVMLKALTLILNGKNTTLEVSNLLNIESKTLFNCYDSIRKGIFAITKFRPDDEGVLKEFGEALARYESGQKNAWTLRNLLQANKNNADVTNNSQTIREAFSSQSDSKAPQSQLNNQFVLTKKKELEEDSDTNTNNRASVPEADSLLSNNTTNQNQLEMDVVEINLSVSSSCKNDFNSDSLTHESEKAENHDVDSPPTTSVSTKRRKSSRVRRSERSQPRPPMCNSRKTILPPSSNPNLLKALTLYLEGKHTVPQLSDSFKIPTHTIYSYIEKIQKGSIRTSRFRSIDEADLEEYKEALAKYKKLTKPQTSNQIVTTRKMQSEKDPDFIITVPKKQTLANDTQNQMDVVNITPRTPSSSKSDSNFSNPNLLTYETENNEMDSYPKTSVPTKTKESAHEIHSKCNSRKTYVSSHSNLLKALTLYLDGKHTVPELSDSFKVPASTIYGYIKKIKKGTIRTSRFRSIDEGDLKEYKEALAKYKKLPTSQASNQFVITRKRQPEKDPDLIIAMPKKKTLANNGTTNQVDVVKVNPSISGRSKIDSKPKSLTCETENNEMDSYPKTSVDSVPTKIEESTHAIQSMCYSRKPWVSYLHSNSNLLKALTLYLGGNHTVAEVSDLFKVPLRTIYVYIEKIQKGAIQTSKFGSIHGRDLKEFEEALARHTKNPKILLRNRKNKTYISYSHSNLLKALTLYLGGNHTVAEVSDLFKVPLRTIYVYIEKIQKGAIQTSKFGSIHGRDLKKFEEALARHTKNPKILLGNRKNKTYISYSHSNLLKALTLYLDGKHSVAQVSDSFKVPLRTIYSYIKKIKTGTTIRTSKFKSVDEGDLKEFKAALARQRKNPEILGDRRKKKRKRRLSSSSSSSYSTSSASSNSEQQEHHKKDGHVQLNKSDQANDNQDFVTRASPRIKSEKPVINTNEEAVPKIQSSSNLNRNEIKAVIVNNAITTSPTTTPILTELEEMVLVDTIILLKSTTEFKISPIDIKRLCFEYCKGQNIPHPFNKSERMASQEWYDNFIQKHPNILGPFSAESDSELRTSSDEDQFKDSDSQDQDDQGDKDLIEQKRRRQSATAYLKSRNRKRFAIKVETKYKSRQSAITKNRAKMLKTGHRCKDGCKAIKSGNAESINGLMALKS